MNYDYFTDSFRHDFARCLFLFVLFPCMFAGMYVYASCGFYEIDLNLLDSQAQSYNFPKVYIIIPLLFLLFSRFNNFLRFVSLLFVVAKISFLGFCFCYSFEHSFQTITALTLSVELAVCMLLLLIYKNSLLFRYIKNESLKLYLKRNYKNIVFDFVCTMLVLLLVY